MRMLNFKSQIQRETKTKLYFLRIHVHYCGTSPAAHCLTEVKGGNKVGWGSFERGSGNSIVGTGSTQFSVCLFFYKMSMYDENFDGIFIVVVLSISNELKENKRADLNLPPFCPFGFSLLCAFVFLCVFKFPLFVLTRPT